MKYFRADADSTHFCGFKTSAYFKADSERDVFDLPTFCEFHDDMYDYLQGHLEEDDYLDNEDADHISMSVTEIDKEEYEEAMIWYRDLNTPYSI